MSLLLDGITIAAVIAAAALVAAFVRFAERH